MDVIVGRITNMTEKELDDLYCPTCKEFIITSKHNREQIFSMKHGDTVTILCNKCRNTLHKEIINNPDEGLFTWEDYDG